MLSPPPKSRSGGAINVLAALLEARTGQQIDANREWRIETALKPLLRERKLDTVDQLVGEILHAGDPTVGDQVVDALLNQETSFFRDAAVLDVVAQAIKELAAPGLKRRLRVWSAGCSTGQEPLSLAMLFNEQLGDVDQPEILATDVSEAALTRGRSGRYSQFEIQRGLAIRRMMQWFDNPDGEWVANPALVRRINFRRLNLVADPLPIGRFDVILCRNVLLYLTAPVRAQIFERFAQVIRPGGLLVLGAGETVIGQTDAFRPSPTYRGLYEPAGVNSRATAAA